MPVPEQLNTEINEALRLIENHPLHEYGPDKRKRLFRTWKSLRESAADLAKRWLAVITAEKVLPFYSLELQADAKIQFDASLATMDEEHLREHYEQEQEVAEMPQKAIDLAKRVLRGESDAEEANRHSNNMHYVVGNLGEDYLLPRAHFVNDAANKALGEVSRGDWYGYGIYNPFDSIEDNSERTDLDWVISGSSDTVACAAVAWAYDEEEKQMKSDRLLQFWHWWLVEAIPQAWEIARENKNED